MSRRFFLLLAVLLSFAAGPGATARPADGPPPAPPPLPFPAHSGFVRAHGARIHYSVFGHGMPVILLHGGLGDSSAWGYQIPVLAERYKVIAIDTRGHGQSTRPRGLLSYLAFADDVIAVMDALNLPQAAMVGWSDGGIVGIDLAIRYPRRVVGLFAFAANSDPSGLINPIDVAELADNDDDDLETAITRLWATQPHFTRDELGRIRTPTYIVAGENDHQIKRRHTVALAAQIPRARLVILPRVGHTGLWRDPERFNRVLMGFLSRLSWNLAAVMSR